MRAGSGPGGVVENIAWLSIITLPVPGRQEHAKVEWMLIRILLLVNKMKEVAL